MANEKNLKKGVATQYRSGEEAARNGRKGGIASGESRRKRKTLAESMKDLLDLPISTARDYNAVAKMGIDPENIDNSQLIVIALFNRAKSGDVSAIKELKKMIGEDDTPNNDTIAKLDDVLKKIGGNI